MPLALEAAILSRIRSAGDLAFELGKRQQHIERQPAHGVGGVERLGDGHERGARRIQPIDDLSEVGERAGQAIDLVDHDRVDPPPVDIGEQCFQPWAGHGSTRETAIIVDRGQHPPALGDLALDVGLAGFALSVQAVEGLIQPLLRTLPRVDRAPHDFRLRRRLGHREPGS